MYYYFIILLLNKLLFIYINDFMCILDNGLFTLNWCLHPFSYSFTFSFIYRRES